MTKHRILSKDFVLRLNARKEAPTGATFPASRLDVFNADDHPPESPHTVVLEGVTGNRSLFWLACSDDQAAVEERILSVAPLGVYRTVCVHLLKKRWAEQGWIGYLVEFNLSPITAWLREKYEPLRYHVFDGIAWLRSPGL